MGTHDPVFAPVRWHSFWGRWDEASLQEKNLKVMGSTDWDGNGIASGIWKCPTDAKILSTIQTKQLKKLLWQKIKKKITQFPLLDQSVNNSSAVQKAYYHMHFPIIV